MRQLQDRYRIRSIPLEDGSRTLYRRRALTVAKRPDVVKGFYSRFPIYEYNLNYF
jgi:hypothetical protein